MEDSEPTIIEDEAGNQIVFDPASTIVNEASADKVSYSNHRFNANFLMPPEPAAVLFIGPRGQGKTTAMLAMLDMLDFDTLSVFSPSINQPKFVQLEDNIRRIEETYGLEIPFFMSDSLDVITDGSYILSRDPDLHHVVILDDWVANEGAKKLAFAQLVLNGRPKGVTSLISTQTFTGLEKKIRDNATHLLFFKCIPPLDIKRIARDYVGDIPPEKFLAMYNKIMMLPGKPFFMFDKMSTLPQLMFRANFDRLWTVPATPAG